MAALKDRGLPIVHVEICNADYDPYDVVGGPGQPVKKLDFEDTRLKQRNRSEDLIGGTVMWFKNRADLERYMEYIERGDEAVPGPPRPQFESGLMLLVLSNSVSPEQAAEYERAFTPLAHRPLASWPSVDD